MTPATREEIEHALPNFYGTECYHKFNLLFTNLYLTDGANFIAEKAGAYWLMDVIASYQPRLHNEPFQVWKLIVKDEVGTVICEDGNDHKLVTQHIGWTDFPLPAIDLWLEYAQDEWGNWFGVILLPSEH